MTDQLDENLKPVNINTSKIKNIYFFPFNYQDALSHLRLIGPARHLGLNVINGVENGHVIVERAQLGDVVVLQRDFPRSIEAYDEILTLARQKQIPVVLDIDDLLFELPEDHPDRLQHVFAGTLLPTFQAMLEVDLVTVTTRPLRDYVLSYNKNVMILPNYLDDQIWRLKPPARKPGSDEKITIGYMGGHTHQSDLVILVPVIQELIQRFPTMLEFQFWGTEPPSELSAYPFVHWHDQITWNYQDFALYFQTQSADVFIAPLVSNKFNNCKSAIKYLEYGSLGVAGIFSQVEPYSAVIKHGVNGLLASSVEEWLDCLAQLIDNPELRYTLATNAQEDIRSNWLLSKNASLWLSAYQNAYDLKSPVIPVNSAYFKMIKNISHQTTSWDRDTKQKLELQKNRIVELEDLVAHRDATIYGITSSKTWKLALLFRRVREIIAPPESWRTRVLARIMRFARAPFKRS